MKSTQPPEKINLGKLSRSFNSLKPLTQSWLISKADERLFATKSGKKGESTNRIQDFGLSHVPGHGWARDTHVR
jgi:hypothetical protein